jgi:hypothetical protein
MPLLRVVLQLDYQRLADSQREIADSPALPLTFAIKTEPAHGTLSGLNTATGAVTYTPGANKMDRIASHSR